MSDDSVTDSLIYEMRRVFLVAHLSPTGHLAQVLAEDMIRSAHDIEDPRLRNGPWRPGWRPFG